MKKTRLKTPVLLMLMAASVLFCTACTEKDALTIDNGSLKTESIKTATMQTLPASDAPVKLSNTEIEELVTILNESSLEAENSPNFDSYGAVFLLTLRQEDGTRTELQYTDGILTVDDETHYTMAAGEESAALDHFFDGLSSETATMISACKSYIDSNDFPAKDSIDYSYYKIDALTYEQYHSMGIICKKELTPEDIRNYRLITVGDIDADYAAILINQTTKEVVGYAPIK